MIGPVVCFGEILLRLGAPGSERLLERSELRVHVGGAEANVAINLALLGCAVRMVSVLPPGPLGEAALRELRAHGVDVAEVRRSAGRMGLYFYQASSGPRPGEVIYDRAGSAFADAAFDAFDWSHILSGARHLHVSGINFALGEGPARSALAAMAAAHGLGLSVSLDVNYRAALWSMAGAGALDRLREAAGHATDLLAGTRELEFLLGIEAAPEGEGGDPVKQAFAAHPRLRRIASTFRKVELGGQQELSGRLSTRERTYVCEPITLSGIVDRVGAGDAFAAGLIFATLRGADDASTLRMAVAAAALKHFDAGDHGQADAAALTSFWTPGVDLRR